KEMLQKSTQWKDQHFSSELKGILAKGTDRELLSSVEEDVVADLCQQMADRGLSLSKRLFEEKVNQLLQLRKQPPVGLRWYDQFFEQHKDQLTKRWSQSMEATCAQAANPTAIRRYFDALQNLIISKGTFHLYRKIAFTL